MDLTLAGGVIYNKLIKPPWLGQILNNPLSLAKSKRMYSQTYEQASCLSQGKKKLRLSFKDGAGIM